MNYRTVTSQYAISPLKGVFIDPALERNFQQAVFARQTVIVQFMAVMGTLFFSLAGLSDWVALPPGPDLNAILLIRGSVLIPALAVYFVCQSPELGRWRDFCVFAMEACLSTAFCLVMMHHYEQLYYYMASVVVVLLAYFLLVPVRFTVTLVNGIYLSTAFLATAAVYLHPRVDELILAAVLLLACIVLAGYVVLRQQIMSRREYINLLELQSSNEKLVSEASQRMEAQQQIEYRLQYEELITRLSTRLISVNGQQLSMEIGRTLEELGRFAQVDRSYIFEFDDSANTETCTHEWCAPGIEPAIAHLQKVPYQSFSWAITRLRSGQTLHIPVASSLPPEADSERREFERESIKSLILIPLIFSRRVVGFIGFDSVLREQDWSSDIIALLRIIGQMLVSAIWRDRAEEALRESQARYQSLASMSPVGIFRADAQGHFTYVNERWCTIAGLGTLEAIGEGWVKTVHQEDRGRVLEEWRNATIRQGDFRSEFRFQKRDGEVTWVLGQARVETQQDNAISGYVGTIDDITSRKRAEQALQERSSELQRANDALESSNLELQQFAYVASHDLQEPLRTISGFSKLIEQRYKGRLDKDADELISYLTQGVARLHSLITDLLNYSRLDTRAQALQPVSLSTILQSALSNLDAAIAEMRAEITQGDLPVLPVDPGQIMLLFQNLIGNSIKFHGDKPPRIHVSAVRDKDGWTLRVGDNGIGIEAKHSEQIFQIFKRLHTSDKYPGTGIGLAVCKRIVERHRGRIWVEPNPGGGSVFCFTLPASNSAATA